MVEVEAETTEKAKNESTQNIDLNQIIEKVRDLVGNVREMASKPMDVKLESFNFAFSKAADGEYGVSVDTKIVFKPK